MKLPFDLPLKKTVLTNYYLALLLREEKATAVIFEEIEGKVKVIGNSEEEFKDSIENASLDEFLDVLDKAISTAESTLPENVETQKTIFGLKETWVQDGKIKKEYLSKLKKASDALGLSPIGFLVIHEAIAHLLQREEGAPITAILVEVGKHYQVVSLLRAGRIVETHRAKIEETISKTTDRLLHHFSSPEVLPARVILFNGNESEDLHQEYISHAWSKSLPFLHVPNTTVLPDGFDAKAMLFGAATQMGFDVLGEELNTIADEIPSEEIAPIEEDEEEIVQPKPAKKSGKGNTDFGFVIGKDVRKSGKIANENIEPVEDFEEEEIEETNLEAESLAPIKPPQNGPSEKNKQNSYLAMATAAFLSVLYKVKAIKKPNINLPLISSPLSVLKGPKYLLVIILILAAIIALLLFYVLGLSAKVTLFANAQNIEKKQDVTLSTDSPTDPSSQIIGVSLLSVDENGNVTEQATGKKSVGTNAKGTVTLHNKNSSSTQLSSGTTITSSNGLKFTIDKDVTIASASATDSGITFGTAQANVTASDIGTNYNLPSGVQFSVNDAVTAKNDNAFQGGTKKDVTVVSKDDMTKAETDLMKSGESKAKDDLQKKGNNDTAIIQQFVDESVSSEKPSKQVGDEATTFQLNGTATYKAASYKKREVDAFAQSLLKENNPDANVQTISYSFDDLSTNKDTIVATLNAHTFLLPKIDEKSLANQIAGKSIADAKQVVTKIPQIGDLTVAFHPNIPFLKTLPRIASHISFTIVKE